jgi:hypothetical protein
MTFFLGIAEKVGITQRRVVTILLHLSRQEVLQGLDDQRVLRGQFHPRDL